MIEVRRSSDRGSADLGWLRSRHSFSFAAYVDPAHVRFGPLRVINEDWIAPGTGFGMHGHRDMEIITYVLSGAISHRDSMGHAGVISAGSVQRMSAGTGVQHSEHNRDSERTTHMLQIWIEPDRRGVVPSYEERSLEPAAHRGALALVASPDGRDGSVSIHQEAWLWAGCFDGTERGQMALKPGRRAYVHVARGRVCVNDQRLEAGDALKLVNESQVLLTEAQGAEVLVFDLP